MTARAFNTITIDTTKNICTKSSTNTEKLRDEVSYYLGLPKSLCVFFPKLINYTNDYSNYSIEYIPYKSLQELILKQEIASNEGKDILEQLIQILQEMHAVKNNSVKLNANQIANFYITKTTDRIQELKKHAHFQRILVQPYLKINGKKYKNFLLLEKDFSRLIHKFTRKNHACSMIHGDFCFSNILYCPSEKAIKLIDPRGSFTAKGIYGHDMYDYAKLMHCLHSGYDYVVNDHFTLNAFKSENFYYEIPSSNLIEDLEDLYNNILIERNINMEFIYLIEASLFLSMASLHYENSQRQILFYLIGIVILNQVIEGKYENMY